MRRTSSGYFRSPSAGWTLARSRAGAGAEPSRQLAAMPANIAGRPVCRLPCLEFERRPVLSGRPARGLGTVRGVVARPLLRVRTTGGHQQSPEVTGEVDLSTVALLLAATASAITALQTRAARNSAFGSTCPASPSAMSAAFAP